MYFLIKTLKYTFFKSILYNKDSLMHTNIFTNIFLFVFARVLLKLEYKSKVILLLFKLKVHNNTGFINLVTLWKCLF